MSAQTIPYYLDYAKSCRGNDGKFDLDILFYKNIHMFEVTRQHPNRWWPIRVVNQTKCRKFRINGLDDKQF